MAFRLVIFLVHTLLQVSPGLGDGKDERWGDGPHWAEWEGQLDSPFARQRPDVAPKAPRRVARRIPEESLGSQIMRRVRQKAASPLGSGCVQKDNRAGRGPGPSLTPSNLRGDGAGQA